MSLEGFWGEPIGHVCGWCGLYGLIRTGLFYRVGQAWVKL